MKLVIDTNVAIAANGRNTHACAECQLACIDFLEKLTQHPKKQLVVLDDAEQIWGEYSSHLNYRGQPGVGDIFFKYLHDNRHKQEAIELVSITPSSDETMTCSH